MKNNAKVAITMAVIGTLSILAVKAEEYTFTSNPPMFGKFSDGVVTVAKEGDSKPEVISVGSVNDFERRLTGVQNQINVLHAKKEDKDPSKNLVTGENFNNLVLSVEGQKRAAAHNAKRFIDLENRVSLLEKKVTHIVNILKLQREDVK